MIVTHQCSSPVVCLLGVLLEGLSLQLWNFQYMMSHHRTAGSPRGLLKMNKHLVYLQSPKKVNTNKTLWQSFKSNCTYASILAEYQRWHEVSPYRWWLKNEEKDAKILVDEILAFLVDFLASSVSTYCEIGAFCRPQRWTSHTQNDRGSHQTWPTDKNDFREVLSNLSELYRTFSS